ncbi:MULTISPECIES: hypothetical protein [Sphingobium]|nr:MULTISPECIES: hypothetical protein [Sphingobium]MBB3928770.1 hypothetical protein [Sphingobium jiangsuense]GLT01943.1 hypothetical protein GCM10007897_33450 [Sphingobium jiangsuense]
MNLPIVYQPHAVSDDNTKSFMLFMADAWAKMQPKKLTLADMDEYWNFGRDDEVMRAVGDIAKAGDEMIRSMSKTPPWRPRSYRPVSCSHTE